MKKSLLFVCMLCAIAFANAQVSLSYFNTPLANGDTVTLTLGEGELENEEVELPIIITNTSDQDVSLRMICKVEQSAEGISVTGLCIDQCKEGDTSDVFTLTPGASEEHFHVLYMLDPSMPHGTTAIYRISTDLENTPYIYAKLVVNTGEGIDDVASAVALNAYPNPSHSQATVTFTLPENCSNGEVMVFDILGNCMARQAVSQNDTQATFNVSTWPYGVYMYGIVANGKIIRMKKLVVE